MAAAFMAKASPQQNCYLEHFNGSMRDELLNGERFTTLLEAWVLIGEWIEIGSGVWARVGLPSRGYDFRVLAVTGLRTGEVAQVAQDRYIPGVPCWVDTSQPDPEAAGQFYRGLFGWQLEDQMPPDSGSQYFAARIRGEDVAAISSVPEGAPAVATWNTYVWVDDADATTEKVRAAGGAVLSDPFDVLDAGRMAVCSDPEGAAFSLWQPNRHRGATIVNQHGAVNFNVLHTRDVDRATTFYGAVFGWTSLDVGGGFTAWALAGYGDFLETINPGTRERNAALDAPAGFEDVVASLTEIGEDEPTSPAHWSVTFGVDDADQAAERTTALGGTVVAGPFDAPWVRTVVITDPQGATFVANQFVPPEPDAAASN